MSGGGGGGGGAVKLIFCAFPMLEGLAWRGVLSAECCCCCCYLGGKEKEGERKGGDLMVYEDELRMR